MKECSGNCREYAFGSENRNPQIEQGFNLHIGKPYRLQVETCVYNGIMTECHIHVCDNGFKLIGATLEDGLFFHPGDPSENFHFESFKVGPGEIRRMGYFGRILDEKGFARARERRKNGK